MSLHEGEICTDGPLSGQRPRRSCHPRGVLVTFADATARPSVLLTARDQAIAAWVTRHGMVTPQQICGRFFRTMPVTWRRLLKLERLGIIRRDLVRLRFPAVVRTTWRGARLAEVNLGPAPLDVVNCRHHLAVVDLSEELLTVHAHAEWITERELRQERADRHRQDPAAPRYRIPDGLMVLDGRRIAVELNRTPKRTRRLDDLALAYASDAGVDAVWWFLPSPEAVARMLGILRSRGLQHLIEPRLRRVDAL